MSANRQQTDKRKAPATAFKPGQSGNPSGRPKIPEEFKQLAKDKSVDALRKVIEILESATADDKDKLKAAEIVMDRAWGKATQSVDADIYNKVIFVIDDPFAEQE